TLLLSRLAKASPGESGKGQGCKGSPRKTTIEKAGGWAVLHWSCDRISAGVSSNKRGGRNHPLPSTSGGPCMGYEQIRIVLNNELSEIAKLHQEVDKFGQKCGLSSKTLFEINLILEEVVENVISYAYEDNRRHEIAVSADLGNGELIIEVEDDGRPFNP